MRILLQPERFDESAADFTPVDVGIGDVVRIEVADRAVEFAEYRNSGELLLSLVQPLDDVGEFLAQRRG